MNTSNPAAFVNAELLPLFVNRRVRAAVQVVGNEAGTIIGKSTDGRQLYVKGTMAPYPTATFVEVIGLADSIQSIRADIITNFGETFDPDTYNRVCQLANAEYRSLFL